MYHNSPLYAVSDAYSRGVAPSIAPGADCGVQVPPFDEEKLWPAITIHIWLLKTVAAIGGDERDRRARALPAGPATS